MRSTSASQNSVASSSDVSKKDSPIKSITLSPSDDIINSVEASSRRSSDCCCCKFNFCESVGKVRYRLKVELAEWGERIGRADEAHLATLAKKSHTCGFVRNEQNLQFLHNLCNRNRNVVLLWSQVKSTHLDDFSFVAKFMEPCVETSKFINVVLVRPPNFYVVFFFCWCDHHLGKGLLDLEIDSNSNANWSFG